MASEEPVGPQLPSDFGRRLAAVIAQHQAFDSPEFKRNLDRTLAQHKALTLTPELKESLARIVAQAQITNKAERPYLERQITEQLGDADEPPTSQEDPFG